MKDSFLAFAIITPLPTTSNSGCEASVGFLPWLFFFFKLCFLYDWCHFHSQGLIICWGRGAESKKSLPYQHVCKYVQVMLISSLAPPPRLISKSHFPCLLYVITFLPSQHPLFMKYFSSDFLKTQTWSKNYFSNFKFDFVSSKEKLYPIPTPFSLTSMGDYKHILFLLFYRTSVSLSFLSQFLSISQGLLAIRMAFVSFHRNLIVFPKIIVCSYQQTWHLY